MTEKTRKTKVIRISLPKDLVEDLEKVRKAVEKIHGFKCTMSNLIMTMIVAQLNSMIQKEPENIEGGIN